MSSRPLPHHKPRRQCRHCPWKRSTDPHDIPHGYSRAKHERLSCTIAEPGSLGDVGRPIRVMACHESLVGAELPCVGWLAHQLGPGNHIALRLAVLSGQIDGHVETVGPQHTRLEDTLPRARLGRARSPARRGSKR